MKENMRLLAGQRFLLEDDKSFWQVLSGQVEVYAVPSSGKLSFRRCYLMELTSGEAIFPAMDEFEEVRIQIYAVNDAVLSCTTLSGAEPAELRPLMEHWFRSLVRIPWLRLIADKGDDMLRQWQQADMLADDWEVKDNE